MVPETIRRDSLLKWKRIRAPSDQMCGALWGGNNDSDRAGGMQDIFGVVHICKTDMLNASGLERMYLPELYL